MTLQDRVACGTADEEVLEATPFTLGCVRANRVINKSQEFLTTACWAVGHFNRRDQSFRAFAFKTLPLVKSLPSHPLGVR